MVKVLFDTNILLDHLKGIPAAEKEIAHYSDAAISIVTKIEVLVGVTQEIEDDVRAYLNSFHVIPLNESISERAIALRRTKKLKLADAIIFASAQESDRLFLTRDAKDFPVDNTGIRIPYKL
jgi:predicted nucleic acid-binding protein